MRTPWRFVADLVSRKPNAEVSDELHSDVTEATAIEQSPANETPLQDVVAEALDPSSEVDTREDTALNSNKPVSNVAAEPAVEEAPSESNNAATVEEPVPLKTTVVTTQRGSRGLANGVVPAAKGALSTTSATANLSIPGTFIDEMAELDTEVEQLRRQLARKLIEQNAQLRRMLDRFEAS